ncbi:hypothetical protein BJ508DRAFT_310810 [Ascobolus immersus RN42]|uniref:Uncharacterized protein n=1 Tax=Ascobolus immersus RN42 TaxID=1160509 RepID=A0A3N4HSL7_ASCIM|nr:hypothetical protein BJ508DRAFT_310810 [Ascobolus immersus RN42]
MNEPTHETHPVRNPQPLAASETGVFVGGPKADYWKRSSQIVGSATDVRFLCPYSARQLHGHDQSWTGHFAAPPPHSAPRAGTTHLTEPVPESAADMHPKVEHDHPYDSDSLYCTQIQYANPCCVIPSYTSRSPHDRQLLRVTELGASAQSNQTGAAVEALPLNPQPRVGTLDSQQPITGSSIEVSNNTNKAVFGTTVFRYIERTAMKGFRSQAGFYLTCLGYLMTLRPRRLGLLRLVTLVSQAVSMIDSVLNIIVFGSVWTSGSVWSVYDRYTHRIQRIRAVIGGGYSQDISAFFVLILGCVRVLSNTFPMFGLIYKDESTVLWWVYRIVRWSSCRKEQHALY